MKKIDPRFFETDQKSWNFSYTDSDLKRATHFYLDESYSEGNLIAYCTTANERTLAYGNIATSWMDLYGETMKPEVDLFFVLYLFYEYEPRTQDDFDKLLDCLSVEGSETDTADKPDLIQMVLDMPTYLHYDGRDFRLVLFVNGTDDFRLCYGLEESGSSLLPPWFHPILNGYKSFLYLVENITSEDELRDAIAETLTWLAQHNIYPAPAPAPGPTP